jgi:adenylylsulfate kinase
MKAEILDVEGPRRAPTPESRRSDEALESFPERVTYVAKILVRNGIVPVVAAPTQYVSTRTWARIQIRHFVEVYVSTPLAVCEARGRKGVGGTVRERWGPGLVSEASMYEPPQTPEITVGTLDRTPRQSAVWVVRELERLGWLPSGASEVYFVPDPFAVSRPVRGHRKPAY